MKWNMYREYGICIRNVYDMNVNEYPQVLTSIRSKTKSFEKFEFQAQNDYEYTPLDDVCTGGMESKCCR